MSVLSAERWSAIPWQEPDIDPAAAAQQERKYQPIHPKRDFEFVVVPLQVSNVGDDSKVLGWDDFRLEGTNTWVSALPFFTRQPRGEGSSTCWIIDGALEGELQAGESMAIEAIFEAPMDMPGRAVRLRLDDPGGLLLRMGAMTHYEFLQRRRPEVLPPRMLTPLEGHEILVVHMALHNSGRGHKTLTQQNFVIFGEGFAFQALEFPGVLKEGEPNSPPRVERRPFQIDMAEGRGLEMPLIFQVPTGAAATVGLGPTAPLNPVERLWAKVLGHGDWPTIDIEPAAQRTP